MDFDTNMEDINAAEFTEVSMNCNGVIRTILIPLPKKSSFNTPTSRVHNLDGNDNQSSSLNNSLSIQTKAAYENSNTDLRETTVNKQETCVIEEVFANVGPIKNKRKSGSSTDFEEALSKVTKIADSLLKERSSSRVNKHLDSEISIDKKLQHIAKQQIEKAKQQKCSDKKLKESFDQFRRKSKNEQYAQNKLKKIKQNENSMTVKSFALKSNIIDLEVGPGEISGQSMEEKAKRSQVSANVIISSHSLQTSVASTSSTYTVAGNCHNISNKTLMNQNCNAEMVIHPVTTERNNCQNQIITSGKQNKHTVEIVPQRTLKSPKKISSQKPSAQIKNNLQTPIADQTMQGIQLVTVSSAPNQGQGIANYVQAVGNYSALSYNPVVLNSHLTPAQVGPNNCLAGVNNIVQSPVSQPVVQGNMWLNNVNILPNNMLFNNNLQNNTMSYVNGLPVVGQQNNVVQQFGNQSVVNAPMQYQNQIQPSIIQNQLINTNSNQVVIMPNQNIQPSQILDQTQTLYANQVAGNKICANSITALPALNNFNQPMNTFSNNEPLVISNAPTITNNQPLIISNSQNINQNILAVNNPLSPVFVPTIKSVQQNNTTVKAIINHNGSNYSLEQHCENVDSNMARNANTITLADGTIATVIGNLDIGGKPHMLTQADMGIIAVPSCSVIDNKVQISSVDQSKSESLKGESKQNNQLCSKTIMKTAIVGKQTDVQQNQISHEVSTACTLSSAGPDQSNIINLDVEPDESDIESKVDENTVNSTGDKVISNTNSDIIDISDDESDEDTITLNLDSILDESSSLLEEKDEIVRDEKQIVLDESSGLMVEKVEIVTDENKKNVEIGNIPNDSFQDDTTAVPSSMVEDVIMIGSPDTKEEKESEESLPAKDDQSIILEENQKLEQSSKIDKVQKTDENSKLPQNNLSSEARTHNNDRSNNSHAKSTLPNLFKATKKVLLTEKRKKFYPTISTKKIHAKRGRPRKQNVIKPAQHIHTKRGRPRKQNVIKPGQHKVLKEIAQKPCGGDQSKGYNGWNNTSNEKIAGEIPKTVIMADGKEAPVLFHLDLNGKMHYLVQGDIGVIAIPSDFVVGNRVVMVMGEAIVRKKNQSNTSVISNVDKQSGNTSDITTHTEINSASSFNSMNVQNAQCDTSNTQNSSLNINLTENVQSVQDPVQTNLGHIIPNQSKQNKILPIPGNHTVRGQINQPLDESNRQKIMPGGINQQNILNINEESNVNGLVRESSDNETNMGHINEQTLSHNRMDNYPVLLGQLAQVDDSFLSSENESAISSEILPHSYEPTLKEMVNIACKLFPNCVKAQINYVQNLRSKVKHVTCNSEKSSNSETEVRFPDSCPSTVDKEESRTVNDSDDQSVINKNQVKVLSRIPINGKDHYLIHNGTCFVTVAVDKEQAKKSQYIYESNHASNNINPNSVEKEDGRLNNENECVNLNSSIVNNNEDQSVFNKNQLQVLSRMPVTGKDNYLTNNRTSLATGTLDNKVPDTIILADGRPAKVLARIPINDKDHYITNPGTCLVTVAVESVINGKVIRNNQVPLSVEKQKKFHCIKPKPAYMKSNKIFVNRPQRKRGRGRPPKEWTALNRIPLKLKQEKFFNVKASIPHSFRPKPCSIILEKLDFGSNPLKTFKSDELKQITCMAEKLRNDRKYGNLTPFSVKHVESSLALDKKETKINDEISKLQDITHKGEKDISIPETVIEMEKSESQNAHDDNRKTGLPFDSQRTHVQNPKVGVVRPMVHNS